MVGNNSYDIVNKMTQEAINKYPGTIDQLKKDWPGIIEDIIEIIRRKNKVTTAWELISELYVKYGMNFIMTFDTYRFSLGVIADRLMLLLDKPEEKAIAYMKQKEKEFINGR